MFIVNKINDIYNRHKCTSMESLAYDREITDISGLEYNFCNIPKVDLLPGGGGAYGHAYHIKRYSGLPESTILNCIIEHGLNVTSHMICEIHASYPVRYILTFSNYRKKIIEEITNMTAIPIGPYIAYADDYRTDDYLIEMKKRYGRILLVFPSHGTEGAEVKYSIDDFSEEIDSISRDFDTVFVSLAAYDIKLGMANSYKRRGYVVVSSGIPNDKYFLSRQKVIFKLADAVCGNSFTTGLSYALYFNKPIYLFRQDFGYSTKNNNIMQLDFSSNVIDELFDVCKDKNFNNLKAQKEWADYYFGLSEVKSREEMKLLLSKMVR